MFLYYFLLNIFIILHYINNIQLYLYTSHSVYLVVILVKETLQNTFSIVFLSL